jgi:hypothetical protein
MRSRGFLIAATLVSVTIACLNACQRSPKDAFVAHGPLPPPPTGEVRYAGTPLVHPFTKQAGNNYARTVFETEGPANSHIEVRDLLIPPRSKSTVSALPGPAVMELAAGGATLSNGDKPGDAGGRQDSIATSRPGSGVRKSEFASSDDPPLHHSCEVALCVVASRRCSQFWH